MAMKLHHWLVLHGISHARFGELLDVHPATIGKYTGGVIPGKKIMRRIYLATDGQVEPNDFYDLSLEHLTMEEFRYVSSPFRSRLGIDANRQPKPDGGGA